MSILHYHELMGTITEHEGKKNDWWLMIIYGIKY